MQEVARTVEQAFIDAGQPPNAESLDFEAFMRLLGLGFEGTSPKRSLEKFASMKGSSVTSNLLDEAVIPSLQEVVLGACSSASSALSATIGRSRELFHEPWSSTAAASTLLASGGVNRSGNLTVFLPARLPSIGNVAAAATPKRLMCASSRSCSAVALSPEGGSGSLRDVIEVAGGGLGGGKGGGRGGLPLLGALHGESGDHEDMLQKLVLSSEQAKKTRISAGNLRTDGSSSLPENSTRSGASLGTC
jgi:hypothetical protein